MFEREEVSVLKDEFTQIKVFPGRKGVRYKNPTSYPFIGRGYSGAVFKLSSTKCVKIFLSEKKCKMEEKALNMGKGSPIMPKLYEVGRNYVVMEFIEGHNLYDYLQKKQKLDDKIAQQILFCLKELKRIKFTRLNIHLRHFIVTGDKKLRVIDHAHAFKNSELKPKHLMKQMEKLGLLKEFLDYVKMNSPKKYNEWVQE